MRDELKARIAQINAGTAPAGYKKTKVGIVPKEWEMVRLGEISDVKGGKRIPKGYQLQEENNGYPYITISDMKNGTVSLEKIKFVPIEVTESIKRYKIYTNDIYISVAGTLGIIGTIPKELNGANLTENADRICNYRCNKQYLIALLSSEIIQLQIQSTQTNNAQPKLAIEQIKAFQFSFPPLPEQQKIAEILTAQDAVIALMQKQIELLKQQKKAFLQKMFPKKGSNVPEIRFAGFTDAWEQRKLGECVTFLDTMRKPLKESEREKGIYPYYGASGIVDYVSDYIFDEELVLLSEDGANITDRNYPVCFLASGKYWVNNHAHVLKVNVENENNFICNSLERMDFTQYNSGMAMPKLNKDVCHNIPLFCPVYEEQKQIGDFFRNLDSLITLHQRKLEIEQQKKKALMQLLLSGKVRVES